MAGATTALYCQTTLARDLLAISRSSGLAVAHRGEASGQSMGTPSTSCDCTTIRYGMCGERSRDVSRSMKRMMADRTSSRCFFGGATLFKAALHTGASEELVTKNSDTRLCTGTSHKTSPRATSASATAPRMRAPTDG